MRARCEETRLDWVDYRDNHPLDQLGQISNAITPGIVMSGGGEAWYQH